MNFKLLIGILLGYLMYMILCPLPSKKSCIKMNQCVIKINNKRYKIHIHHWILSLLVLYILQQTNMKISDIMKGFIFSGIIHGILEYDDWNRIIYNID